MAVTIGVSGKVDPGREDSERIKLNAKSERTACFCIYDNEADPRICVWKNGKAFPSPNIATHRGKAILAVLMLLVLSLGIAFVVLLVKIGGAPGLADRKRAPPDPNEPTCCGGG